MIEFNDARNSEYHELSDRVPSFLEELAMDSKRGCTTYAEAEESEADLERFRSWLGKVARRDYLHVGDPDQLAHPSSSCHHASTGLQLALQAFGLEQLQLPFPPR